MNNTQAIALVAGGSWASGVNLYLTVAGLGIAHRLEWITLPGDAEAIAHPLIIGLAVLLYTIEFFADKIPFVDSIWDSFHTLIRPAGSAALGYMASANMGHSAQLPIALICGTIALDSHLTKATTRAAINTSPEPFTNSIASVTEDIGVMGTLYLIIKHPAVITVLVIVFFILSLWFLKIMFRFVKKLFQKKKTKTSSSLKPQKTNYR